MNQTSQSGVRRIDVCRLEPPEPMVQVLDALSVMADNERLLVLIDREPHPLYRILDGNGLAHRTEARPDHLYEILIWSKSDGLA
jgi:uncharacterized protein (DUF2249 family)